jgi:3-hydroxyacyl-[acyl-carrier-protein] dehydratase
MRQVHSFRVEADHPALEGHFPGRPIVPGVVLLDEALAAIEAVCGLAPPLRLARVKFTALVLPGQSVDVLLDEPRDGRVSFACASGGRRVLSGIVQS